MERDGMRQVRAELCERIDGIRAALPFGSVSGMCDRASDLRHVAQRHDLRPVADLAWKLEGRLARGETGPSVLNMLSQMREATESNRAESQASGARSTGAPDRLA